MATLPPSPPSSAAPQHLPSSTASPAVAPPAAASSAAGASTAAACPGITSSSPAIVTLGFATPAAAFRDTASPATASPSTSPVGTPTRAAVSAGEGLSVPAAAAASPPHPLATEAAATGDFVRVAASGVSGAETTQGGAPANAASIAEIPSACGTNAAATCRLAGEAGKSAAEAADRAPVAAEGCAAAPSHAVAAAAAGERADKNPRTNLSQAAAAPISNHVAALASDATSVADGTTTVPDTAAAAPQESEAVRAVSRELTAMSGVAAAAGVAADATHTGAAYAASSGAAGWRLLDTELSSFIHNTPGHARSPKRCPAAKAAAATCVTSAAASSERVAAGAAFAVDSTAAEETAVDSAAAAARHTTVTSGGSTMGDPHNLEAAGSAERGISTSRAQDCAGGATISADAGGTAAEGGEIPGAAGRAAAVSDRISKMLPAAVAASGAAPGEHAGTAGAEELAAANQNTRGARRHAGSAAARNALGAVAREVTGASTPVYFPLSLVVPPPTLPLILPSVLLPLQQEGDDALADLPQQQRGQRAAGSQQQHESAPQHVQHAAAHHQPFPSAFFAPSASSILQLQQQVQRASELCANLASYDWTAARSSLPDSAPATAAAATAAFSTATAAPAASDARPEQELGRQQWSHVRGAAAPPELGAAASVLPTSLACSSNSNTGPQHRRYIPSTEYGFKKCAASPSTSSSSSSTLHLHDLASWSAAAQASVADSSLPDAVAADPDIDNWWRYAPPSSLPEEMQQQRHLRLLQRRQCIQERLYATRRPAPGSVLEARAAAAVARVRETQRGGQREAAAATRVDGRRGGAGEGRGEAVGARDAGKLPAPLNEAAVQLVRQRVEELQQAVYRYYPPSLQQQQERREVLLLPSFEGDNSTAFLAGFAAAADAAEAAAGAAVAAASAAAAALSRAPTSEAHANAQRRQEEATTTEAATYALPPEIVQSLRRQDDAIAATARAAAAARAAAVSHVATTQAAPPFSCNFVPAATYGPCAAEGSRVAGNSDSSNRGRSSRTSHRRGSTREHNTPDAAARSSFAATPTEEENLRKAASTADCVADGIHCEAPARGDVAAITVSPLIVESAASADTVVEGGAAAAATRCGDRDARGTAKGSEAADGERKRVTAFGKQEEDGPRRERSKTPVTGFVPLDEVLPSTDLRCTYASYMARVYAQQVELWQRFATQLTLQLQISHLASSSTGAAASSTSAGAAAPDIAAAAAARSQPSAAFSAAAVGPPAATAAAFAALATEDGSLRVGLQQNAAAAYYSTSAAAAGFGSRSWQQQEQVEAARLGSSGAHETGRLVFVRDPRSERPVSRGEFDSFNNTRQQRQEADTRVAGATATDCRSRECGAATTGEATAKREVSGPVQATGSPAPGDTTTSGAEAATAEAAAVAGEYAAAPAEGGDQAAGDNARRRVPAWQQYNVGLLVRLLLLLFLFDAGKEVYVSTLLLGLLYVGGVFDPIINWFQRSSHRQPLDVQQTTVSGVACAALFLAWRSAAFVAAVGQTLARLRRRRERRPLRRLQRQQRLLRASTELNSERRRAAAEIRAAGTVEATAAAAASVAASTSREGEQSQLAAERIRGSNASTEGVQNAAAVQAAPPGAGALEIATARERAAAARAAAARAAAARAAAAAAAAAEGSERLSKVSDVRVNRVFVGDMPTAGDSAASAPVQQDGEVQHEQPQKGEPSGGATADRVDQLKEKDIGDLSDAEEEKKGKFEHYMNDLEAAENKIRATVHRKMISRQQEVNADAVSHSRDRNRRTSTSDSDAEKKAECRGYEGADVDGTEALDLGRILSGETVCLRKIPARETAVAPGESGTATVSAGMAEEEEGTPEDKVTGRHGTSAYARLQAAGEDDNSSARTEHCSHRENYLSERLYKFSAAASNPRTSLATAAASSGAFVAASRSARAAETSAGGQFDLASGSHTNVSCVGPSDAAATATEQQQRQQPNQSSNRSRHVDSSSRTEGRRRRQVGWRTYYERAFYEGVVMFFLTFIPSWNPNPQYLRDLDDDEDEEDEDEQEEADDLVMPAGDTEDGLIVREQEGFDL